MIPKKLSQSVSLIPMLVNHPGLAILINDSKYDELFAAMWFLCGV